jgi:hypothetical protein
MKRLRTLKKHTKTLLVLSSIAMISFNSYAGRTPVVVIISNSNIMDNNDGTSTVSVDIGAKNGCNGYFSGKGFSNCRISINPVEALDPDKNQVIIKFDNSFNVDDSNSNTIGDIDATKGNQSNDFTLINTKYNDDNEDIGGTWALNNITSAYPDIYFWLAKAGAGKSDAGKSDAGFRLFWQINNIDNTNNTICNQSSDNFNFSLGCMNLAQSVTSGDWTTPANKGLSHITFFGGLCTVNCDVPPTPVPEPSTLVIFALGLLGLGVRRKQSIKVRK